MNNKDKKGGGVNPAPFKYMEIKNIEINIKFLCFFIFKVFATINKDL